MSKTRFTPWVVLACIGTLAGCTSGEGGTAGNTDLNIVLPNGCAQDTSAPDCFDIQVVEYTIACDDGDPTPNGPFLDNNAGFDDRVVINGVLEVFDTPQPGRDGRAASGDPWTWGNTLGDIYVAQGFMDLPVTQNCTAQLRARDAGNEVICSDTVTFGVQADTVSTVNVLMYCGLSFQAPVAQLDLAGDFSFNVSNFCPDLFVLNCIDSDIDVRPIPGLGNLAVTACQTRFRDGDNQCGDSCDPQECTTAPEGLRCAPECQADNSCPTEPTTTVTCAGGASAIDCDGFPNLDPSTGAPLPPDPNCVFMGNTLGVIGGPAPGPPPALGGPGAGPGGFFVLCAICDASYIALTQDQDPRCNSGNGPTGLPVTPGADVTCTAVTTDGDNDCDKTKTVELTCPGLSACQAFGGDEACDDGNPCTINTCNDATGVAVCEADTTTNDGNSCTPPTPGAGVCQGGVCVGTSCAAQCDPAVDPENCDASCDDQNECTFADVGTCDLTTGNCGTLTNRPTTFACDSGAGTSGAGLCDGAGACANQDDCTAATEAADCGVNTNECLINQCNVSGAPWVCETVPNTGANCDSGAGVCDDAGACVLPPAIDAGAADTAWRALPINCATGTFPFIDTPRADCALCLSNSCVGGPNATRACTADAECEPGGVCGPSTPGPLDCSLDCFMFNCDELTDPPFEIPKGGQAVYPTGGGAVTNAAVRGCEVVSNTLKNQLAIDVTAFLDVSSDGAGNLTVTYNVVGANAGLALAAPLANLADVTIDTLVSNTNTPVITSKLDPALSGTSVGAYIKPVGNNEDGFVLNPRLIPSGTESTTDVPPVTELVRPNSFDADTGLGTVDVNFDPAAILIELVIVSSGAPLDITGGACTFNNPEATCYGGTNAFERCDPSDPGGGPGGADCTASNPVVPPGECVPSGGTAITLTSCDPNVAVACP